MLISINILFIILVVVSSIVISVTKHLYKLKQKFEKQSKKIINLYLDKKFICKLLSLFMASHKTIELRTILDEVLDYFFLDFIALYATKQNNTVSCNSLAMNEFYTKNDINLLLDHSKMIEKDIGYALIKTENDRQFIVFKYNKICMLIVVEKKHELSKEEKETLNHDIMLILTLAANIIAVDNQKPPHPV